jgi:hypothetical protein
MTSANPDRQPLFDGHPFTTSEAREAGIDQVALRRRLRQGDIRRIVRGVYVDGTVSDTLELRASAVAKVVPPDAVACRRTAAWLYGVDTFAIQYKREPPPLETLRPTERRAVRTAGTTGHVQTVLPGDVVVRHGLRLTSPVATAVHLARHLDRPFALSGLDAMCHAGLVGPAELITAVKRYPHHPGIVKARELVRLVEPATESPGESWLRLRLIDACLGTPLPQVEVVDGLRTYRIDIAMRELLPDGRRLGLKYDSACSESRRSCHASGSYRCVQ